MRERKRLRAESMMEVSRTYKLPKWEAQLLSHIERKWGKDGILLCEFAIFAAYILMFSALFVSMTYQAVNPVSLSFGLFGGAFVFLVAFELLVWGWKRSSMESGKVEGEK